MNICFAASRVRKVNRGSQGQIMRGRLIRWVLSAVMMLSVTSSSSIYASVIRAEIDRDKIYLDESVNLILTMEGESENVGGNPDLTGLRKDFDVLSESTQTNIRIENGVSVVIRNWIFGIRPKRAGTIEIPAIAVGGAKSNSVQLEVEEFKGNVSEAGADLFLEFEAVPQNPYVQSQVILAVRLFTAVDISHGRLSDPVLNFATIEQLGQDRRYQSKRSGMNYDVIERRFALFPEQSGTHEIPSMEFSGVVSRYNATTLQTEYARERISSEPVALRVRPKPSGYSGQTWLPTSELQLSDSWKGRLPDFEFGKPENRKLSIEALGLRAVQLSSPQFETDQSVRIYSNTPKLNTVQTAGTTVARRDEEFIIIPGRSDELTIPEFRVVWWDTDEDREKVAILPEISTTLASASTVASAAAAADDSIDDVEMASAQSQVAPAGGTSSKIWMWISFGMLLMWSLTLAGWHFSRRKPASNPTQDVLERDERALSIRKSLATIKRACRDNDVSRVGTAMLDLAQLWWPDRPPRNLIEFGLRTRDGAFELELRNLDSRMYSGESSTWDGDRFWQELTKVRKDVQAPLKNRRPGFLFGRTLKPSEDLWFDRDVAAD